MRAVRCPEFGHHAARSPAHVADACSELFADLTIGESCRDVGEDENFLIIWRLADELQARKGRWVRIREHDI